jgi:hypothetical protein
MAHGTQSPIKAVVPFAADAIMMKEDYKMASNVFLYGYKVSNQKTNEGKHQQWANQD